MTLIEVPASRLILASPLGIPQGGGVLGEEFKSPVQVKLNLVRPVGPTQRMPHINHHHLNSTSASQNGWEGVQGSFEYLYELNFYLTLL